MRQEYKLIVLYLVVLTIQCKNRSTMYPVANAYTALWNTSITCSFKGHVLYRHSNQPDTHMYRTLELTKAAPRPGSNSPTTDRSPIG